MMNRLGWPVTSFSPFMLFFLFLPCHPFLILFYAKATICSLMVRKEDWFHLVTDLSVSTWSKTPPTHEYLKTSCMRDEKCHLYFLESQVKAAPIYLHNNPFCTLLKYFIFTFTWKAGVSPLPLLWNILTLNKWVRKPYMYDFPFGL